MGPRPSEPPAVESDLMSVELRSVLGSAPNEGALKEPEGPGRPASNGGASAPPDQARPASRPTRPAEPREDPNSLRAVYQGLIMGIIRPPRMPYEYPRGLGAMRMLISGSIVVQRTDFYVTNPRGHRLECSIWRPDGLEASGWPCVVYLHGNSSSRLEAVKTNVLKAVMASNCALVGFDFAGCGNSEGDYVSLGWFEHVDAAAVVRQVKGMGAGRVVLWGRSMGAVTALLYAASPDNDPPAGIIADSPFTSFKQLAYDLTSKGVVRVPRFLAATVLSMIRRSVRARANFDLFKIKPLKHCGRCTCPALFFVAEGDELIPPFHAEAIAERYGGPSVGVRFDGTHNSARPAVLYALASVFITGTVRRTQYPPEVTLGLVEKTAVVTCQEDERDGRMARHPYRYDGRDPRFVRAGSHAVQHITQAAHALVSALDASLAIRAVEDFLIDEMAEVAVAMVHKQLQAVHQPSGAADKAALLEEVGRVQLAHAMAEAGNAALGRAPRGQTGWEALVDQSHEHAEESQQIVEGLRRIHASRIYHSPDPESPGEVRSAVSVTSQAQLVKPKPAAGLRLCCFDPRDALLSESPGEQDHLPAIAEELFHSLPVAPTREPPARSLSKKASRRLDSLEVNKPPEAV